MSRCKEGDRVGALASIVDGVARLYGFGTYVGEHIPPKEAGGLNLGIPNPKIELDSGKTVYGCECWWGAEEKVKAGLQKCKEVIDIDIDEERKRKA